MNIAQFISNWWKETLEYKERVLKDGGFVRREDNVQKYIQLCKQNGMYDSIKFGWISDAGGKLRNVSSSENRWAKLHSLVVPQAKYGPELIVNGGFDTDQVWTKGTGWSISEGAAVKVSGSASNIVQGVTEVGKKYKITFTVVSYDGLGTVGAIVGNTASYVNAIGTFTLYIIAADTSGYGIRCSSTTNATVDNVSCVEVINSIDGSPTDATQTTSTSQPLLGGNIAPTEKWCLKNPNGGSNYMTHPTISFAANEQWSVTTVVNWNGNNNSYDALFGSTVSTIRLRDDGYNKITFINESLDASDTSVNTSSIISKNTILSFVALGNGTIKIYINGIFKAASAITSNFAFNRFLCGRSHYTYSSIYSHIIRAQALTPSQVAAEANFLRSLYPEIPSVTIGSQVWATSNCDMVATQQGNLMQNITANSNAEKITNAADRDFSSDTGFWMKTDASITIGGGVCNYSSTPSNKDLARASVTTLGKWYKCVLTVLNYSSGGIRIALGSANGITRNTNGTYTEYLCAAGNTTIYYNTVGVTSLQIDNVSVEEVGWSDSTNLYNAIYAATSGTDEQKTHAAVKATAMWCYYNNDPALGAIYNKLYNWYAIKLLQMDIQYYLMANTANVIAIPYSPSKVYYVRINARTSGVGTVTINANGMGYSPTITLSGTDTLYELYVRSSSAVTPSLTYSGTGSMTVNEFTMYEDIYGYRCPTDIDFNNLATALGGVSVAGGKMKKDGLVYWLTPNTGADNSSGFSAIGVGYRQSTGVFVGSPSASYFTSITEYSAANLYSVYVIYNSYAFSLNQTNSKIIGFPLRLIKS